MTTPACKPDGTGSPKVSSSEFVRRCATPHPDGGVEYGKHSFDADGYCNVCGVHRNITLHHKWTLGNKETPNIPDNTQ